MTIVVTGVSGNVGRPLVEQLLRAGAHVRAVTRRAEGARMPAGAELFADAADAVKGASAVFLNSRALGPALADVVSCARRQGVAKLVALSAINADDDDARQPSRYRGDRNRECEQLAVASGLSWVSLRPSVFASNFPGMWAAQISAGDVVAGPYAGASAAPIAEADIAAVAARALLTDDLVGRRIPLTGPQSLTNSELVTIVGTVLRRPLRYLEVPAESVRERFVANGFSAQFADAYIAMQEATATTPAVVTDDVERILDRPATPFARWAADHTALFSKEKP
ncbi:NAD(P)H-binding protein [Mycobacterium sp. NBC_00419]|uniref:NAD(P)H-binding protein n=1 Tax=Mycobacterium sp. NBC_00419 TaxID=2975989 RepID=UPI002E1D875F